LTRVLVPFWVYAAVCLGLEAWKAPPALRVFDVHWLVPTAKVKSPVPPLAWHLWFVPIYLTVMALFPGLRAVFERLPSWKKALPPVALVLALVALDDFGARREFLRLTLFYTFWAYLGLCYTRWKARPWPRGAVLAVSACAYFVLWRLLAHRAYGPDFQWNKFPPNFAFVLLSIGHFGLLALAAPWIRAFARQRVVRLWTAPYRAFGYTVYLFHPVAFMLLWIAFESWPAVARWVLAHPATTIALFFPASTFVVPVIAWPFSVAERLRLRPRAPAGSLGADPSKRRDPPHPWAGGPFPNRSRGLIAGRGRSQA
jgi:hypothetical protein